MLSEGHEDDAWRSGCAAFSREEPQGMRRKMKRFHLIVAVAALIALSALAVAASGRWRTPMPHTPGSVYVYWCHNSPTSEKRLCRGSTSGRPGKLEPRAR